MPEHEDLIHPTGGRICCDCCGATEGVEYFPGEAAWLCVDVDACHARLMDAARQEEDERPEEQGDSTPC